MKWWEIVGHGGDSWELASHNFSVLIPLCSRTRIATQPTRPAHHTANTPSSPHTHIGSVVFALRPHNHTGNVVIRQRPMSLSLLSAVRLGEC